MDEFSLIACYFAPLAGPEGLNLTDDAALLTLPTGEQLVATKDVISAGVHFVGDEPPELIARKLLRVNLSDLAAMGATPYAYLLGLAVPKETPDIWFKQFADGLAQDQKVFGIHLVGGDTTATAGTLTLSLTALGRVKKGEALRRGGARPGDGLYVTGTLGDAALGLKLLKEGMPNTYLIRRYQLPEPRVALGQALHGIASAAIDISDGLVQDLGHICDTSGCGAHIYTHLLPCSVEAKKTFSEEETLDAALAGGDDYELLFTSTAPEETIQALGKKLGVPISRIGDMLEEKIVNVTKNGEFYSLKATGYRHF